MTATLIRSGVIVAHALAGGVAVILLYAHGGAHPPILKGSWCQAGSDFTSYRRCYQHAGAGVIRITADKLITVERECDAIGRAGWRMQYRCSNGAIEQWRFALVLKSLIIHVENDDRDAGRSISQ
jgi:hypothetical protein